MGRKKFPRRRDDKTVDWQATGGKDKDGKDDRDYQKYTELSKTNAMFEAYYKGQGIIPEGEWDDFMASLRRELPQSWRFIGGSDESSVLHSLMCRRYIDTISTEPDASGVVPQRPIAIDWYPEGKAYQFHLGRRALRKEVSMLPLHNFLVTETELGNISRQEVVSMIPPLLLDVQPHHRVLDMCAAPGSKTAQIVEALHRESFIDPKKVPTGCVIANDLDNTRCYMLVRQAMRRLPSPCVMVTNCNAQHMPNIKVSAEGPEGTTKNMQYDRILCDVMCSGDGTVRKAPDMWKKWNPNMGIALYTLQFGCARRAVELLTVGGLLVYSTCSLNPIEDECVVANLLKECEGTLELVDCSDKLPGLKRCEGMTKWKLMDKQNNFFETVEDVPEVHKSRLRPHFFPPPADVAGKMNLKRCIRILPHHQDTGGFFIAVLRKTADVPWSRAAKQADQEPAAKRAHVEGEAAEGEEEKKNDKEQATKKGKGRRIFKEEPFVFMDKELEESWKTIRSHYGMSPEFNEQNLLTRADASTSTRRRNVYYVTDVIKDILQNNQSLKIINAGLRVFGRVETKFTECPFRIAQDGIDYVHPYMSARTTALPVREDYVALLRADKLVMIDQLTEEMQKLCAGLKEGSHVMHAKCKGHRDLEMCVWKGARSIAPYASRECRLHQLRMLEEDTEEIERQLAIARKSGGRVSTLAMYQKQGEKNEGGVKEENSGEVEGDGKESVVEEEA